MPARSKLLHVVAWFGLGWIAGDVGVAVPPAGRVAASYSGVVRDRDFHAPAIHPVTVAAGELLFSVFALAAFASPPASEAR